tara:strand:- start:771 stop:1229 length:459 start_codon:yes stop_codon:yes gene_type:complete
MQNQKPQQIKQVVSDVKKQCEAIVDKLACDDIVSFVMGAMIRVVEKVLSDFKPDEMSKNAKIHLVATLVADIETFILPIHAKLKGEDEDKGYFNASRLARKTGAIEENEGMQVDHRYIEEGQEIGVRIGEVAGKEIRDVLENYNADEIVGQS